MRLQAYHCCEGRMEDSPEQLSFIYSFAIQRLALRLSSITVQSADSYPNS